MSIKAMKQALGALISAEVELDCEYGATEILRQAIAEAEKQEQSEPVAWQWLGSAHFRKKIPKNADKSAWNPLYNTPQPAQKPLTDEQAMDAYCETPPFGTYKEAFIAGIRFIEAAHGIKENT